MKPRRENRETALVRAALELLHRHGIPAWRNNTGMAVGLSQLKKPGADPDKFRPTRYGVKGMADIIGIVPRDIRACECRDGWRHGQFLAIECKVGRGTLSYDQWVILSDIRDAGGIAITLYDDCEGLIDAIRDGRSSSLGPCPPKPVKKARKGKGDRRQLTFARRSA